MLRSTHLEAARRPQRPVEGRRRLPGGFGKPPNIVHDHRVNARSLLCLHTVEVHHVDVMNVGCTSIASLLADCIRDSWLPNGVKCLCHGCGTAADQAQISNIGQLYSMEDLIIRDVVVLIAVSKQEETTGVRLRHHLPDAVPEPG